MLKLLFLCENPICLLSFPPSMIPFLILTLDIAFCMFISCSTDHGLCFLIVNFVASGYTRVSFLSLFIYLPFTFIIQTLTFALSQVITVSYIIKVLHFLCLSVAVVVIIIQFSSVQSLSRVWLFETPWAAARQASLSITKLLELAQAHVHRWCHRTISSSIVPFSPPAFNLFQHQGLFKWVSSSHQLAKVLEFQL